MSGTLAAVAYNEQNSTPRFVSTGIDANTVASSLGGSGWAFAGSGLPNVVRAVTFGNGTFVAGADDSRIYTSATASSWAVGSNPFSPSSTAVYGLAFNGGVCVAIGNQGDAVAYSAPNRLDSWTRAPVVSALNQYRAVTAVSNSGFVVCGLQGAVKYRLDGAAANDWKTLRIAGNPNLLGVASGSGRVVAVGQSGKIFVSTDPGKTWTDRSPGVAANLNAIAYSGSGFYANYFVAVGDNGLVLTSSDAVTWEQLQLTPAVNLRGVTFDQARGVAVIAGDSGSVFVGGLVPTYTQSVLPELPCSATVNQRPSKRRSEEVMAHGMSPGTSMDRQSQPIPGCLRLTICRSHPRI